MIFYSKASYCEYLDRQVLAQMAACSKVVLSCAVLRTTPSLYPLLSTILNHFRMNSVAMVGDISKMFREVGLVEEDRDLHRFLHKNNAGKIVDVRMSRVTFGITSSPFLATQVLRHLADEYASLHPAAAKEIKQSFYVDDVLTGAQTVEQAIQLRKELKLLLSKGCMALRKWRASHPEVLDSTPIDLQESSILSIATSPVMPRP